MLSLNNSVYGGYGYNFWISIYGHSQSYNVHLTYFFKETFPIELFGGIGLWVLISRNFIIVTYLTFMGLKSVVRKRSLMTFS